MKLAVNLIGAFNAGHWRFFGQNSILLKRADTGLTAIGVVPIT
jgi:hypothetical protein